MDKWLEKRIPLVGKRSLLFGVHQVIWHPITVLLAWVWLYKRLPSFKELICIIIHDWGYFFSENMDGIEGEKHPEYGARLAGRYLGKEYKDLILYHSRHYALTNDVFPSRLCWQDKYSIMFEPKWFYLFRARLSGEIKEYRKNSSVPFDKSDSEWFDCLRSELRALGIEKNPNAAPYQKKSYFDL
jgi:hypothetical protein